MRPVAKSAVQLAGKGLLASGVTRLSSVRRLTFRLYYAMNAWEDAESRSGVGSNLEKTDVIRHALPPLFERLGVATLLDVPCGDGHWWHQVDHHLVEYIGVDIVPEVIKRRQAAGRPNERYLCLDAATDPLPTADAVLCRDLMVHLSNSLVRTTLRNLKDSGARFLIATTFPGVENTDIPTGRWRRLDLTAPPFSLPRPVELVPERSDAPLGKSLGVWRMGDIVLTTP